jgi:Predicted SAM-dependent methyltransferase
VLAKLGARVIAVDKAPLDPAVAALPGVEIRQASAFALDPAEIGPVDWLFSDVICYPARLLLSSSAGSPRAGPKLRLHAQIPG